MPQPLEFSVIVPVFNEAENVEQLAREIAAALDGRNYEVIFVDDASTDDTLARLSALKPELDTLRVIGHRKNAGQSRAIRTGVEAARGRVIGTLDGDGQNDPADLPDLYRQLTRQYAPERLVMVMGRRDERQDSAWRRFGSWVANVYRGWLLRDECEDSGCGIKVIYRDTFLKLPFFDHMHRYMPALVQGEGLETEFVSVRHRPRVAGKSKYTHMGRWRSALSDLNGVRWLRKRRRSIGGADEV